MNVGLVAWNKPLSLGICCTSTCGGVRVVMFRTKQKLLVVDEAYAGARGVLGRRLTHYIEEL